MNKRDMANTFSGFNFLCLFTVLSIIFGNLSFVQASVSGNCSTRASYVYCLDSGLSSTWYNNNSVIMNNWQMRVFLLFQNDDGIDLYCGFYCNGTCKSYLFSVVAVADGGSHRLVWSANRDRPVTGNAMVELTRSGLLLRDSDGTEVWSSNKSLSGNPVVGMNLNQSGNLILFSNESHNIWESPAAKISLNFTPNPSAITPSSPLPADNTPPGIISPTPTPPSPPVPPGGGGRNFVGIIAGSVAGGIFIIGVVIFMFVKIRRPEVEEKEEDYIKIVPGMPVRFSYEELRVATNDFKERLGGGGFGTVYKGVLQNGMIIAVKRLDRMGQGMREFLAEVETIGSLHHFNLVRLIGFCVERTSRLLVYEYMCNGSLDKWIFIRDERPNCLDWQTRKKIILDVAKGLAYLHEDCRQRIIHLDIKPQNILLDENFNAKVSDFGLSQLIDRDESQVFETTMRGTPGYIAPEWRKSKITVKVDIYSFGIVLLEVVSARRNLDSKRSESSFHLLKLLQTKAEENQLLDIVDSVGENTVNAREEMVKMIKVGAWCLQDDPTKRPSMSTVVKVLEGVMEVDENITYRFSHAKPFVSVVMNEPFSAPPPASVLSDPR